MLHRVQPGREYALFDSSATRQIERMAQANLDPHALMQRAGLAAAKLSMAIAPHAQRIWIACGPGNNGGDGFEAAIHLKQWGKEPVITWNGGVERSPVDAKVSMQRAIDVGVKFSQGIPEKADLCIDAMLGLGSNLREPQGEMAIWIDRLNSMSAPTLAIDIATGLDANTGTTTHKHVKASHTLSMLTLKPGLFMGRGRAVSGVVWLENLKIAPELLTTIAPSALLITKCTDVRRSHDSHKGTYGDVAVVGGAPGMAGASLLAARAALHAGAGRVFIGLLDENVMPVDVVQPELMFRTIDELDFNTMTVVCGCGGGHLVDTILHQILLSSGPVVLDADAINALAKNLSLQTLLRGRNDRGDVTVMTPHPLEAARLLDCDATQVQKDRLFSADVLAKRFGCTVVLKGSGTVIAAPGQTSAINITGNARLATAGTGDVLAGIVGAKLASCKSAFQAACEAVYQHGEIADSWSTGITLTASRLAQQLPLTDGIDL
jgi:hydroxyethylthiazole kinase-like uncharacterized protein yjeF